MSLQHHPRYCLCISSVPLVESSNPVASVCKTFPWRSSSSKRVHRHCNTKHRDKAHDTENEDKRSCTHVHKTTNRFKSSSTDNHSKKVPNCLTTVKIHKCPSLVQSTWTTVPKQLTTHRTTTRTCYDPQLLGFFIWPWVISLNPITATSLDHTSTLVQNDQQQNKEQKQSTMQKSPMSPQMSN